MLTDYLKAQQFYRPVQRDSRSFNRGVGVSIALCCCVLVLIAIILPLALIPLYIKKEDGITTTNSNSETNLGKDQQLLFRLPQLNSSSSWLLKNGDLNSTGLEQLREIIQSTMESSSNEMISTSKIIVKHATIVDGTDVNTRKRRQDQTKTKLLNVTCALQFIDKYSYYTQLDYGSILNENVATIKLPTILLTMVAGTCWDTVGYFEPVTGHTCQTYIDYGFCNGTNILTGSAIDSQLAQQNCCSCGKQA